MKINQYLKLKEEANKESSNSVEISNNNQQNDLQKKDVVFSEAIISHGSCPDGVAAVVLAKKVYSNIRYFLVNHRIVDKQVEKVVQKIEPGGKLLMVDICCSKNVLEKIIKICNEKKVSIAIYEHHLSVNWLQEFYTKELDIKIIYDEKRCGSKIFYEEFSKEYPILKEYQRFIQLTNDKDLWLNQHKEESILLVKLHNILGDKEYYKRFLNNPSTALTKKESLLIDFVLEEEKKRKEKLFKNLKIKKDHEGYRYGVIYGEGESSELLNEALYRFNLEYAILVDLNNDKGSIRGRGNFDCSAFAEEHGGGGHRCASGFRITFEKPEF